MNIPKPLMKYMTIALAAVVIFFLIYTYVKLTNDRVYEIADKQVADVESNPSSRHEADKANPIADIIISAPTTLPVTANPANNAAVTDAVGKKFVAGKNPRICMKELKTDVINNEVVKCTHDHYE